MLRNRLWPDAAHAGDLFERADRVGGDDPPRHRRCLPGQAESVAADGKSACGSRRGGIPSAHLLAAMTSGGRTLVQLRVPGKTDEIEPRNVKRSADSIGRPS
ncbi:hypothetical protein [Streptomyces sp. NPDC048419]|uniref:hypothetical protein n=1 Tax=Streptomyces sp. NPDC048419 TaxID=3365547 RepID=UPI00371D4A22